MEDRTASLRLAGPRGTIEVAGHDMSRAVSGIELEHRAGERPRLRLDLLLHEVTIDGEMQAIVPDETAAALVALGWTPPREQPPVGWLAEALRSPAHRSAVAAEVRRMARVDQAWAREAMGHQCRSKR
jgi:hypothetical protein